MQWNKVRTWNLCKNPARFQASKTSIGQTGRTYPVKYIFHCDKISHPNILNLKHASPAELQLVFAVLEVNVVYGVSDVSTPVAGFVPLEVGTPALGEAHFRTERFLSSRCLQWEHLLVARHLLAPGAHCASSRNARRICGNTGASETILISLK